MVSTTTSELLLYFLHAASPVVVADQIRAVLIAKRRMMGIQEPCILVDTHDLLDMRIDHLLAHRVSIDRQTRRLGPMTIAAKHQPWHAKCHGTTLNSR